MKKNFKFYALLWVLLIALFNVIAFVSVGWEEYEKYSDSFWIGYAFISVMFVGQLICAILAFRADSAQKLFYNISLLKTSYSGLIASFIVGGLCMFISPVLWWVAVLVCAIILSINVLSILKATVAVSEVVRIDEKIKTKTFFIKSLTIDAETLLARAETEAAKAECKKVYEAIRYSDPMSNEALASVESQITVKFAELSDAVKANDAEKVAEAANEVVILVSDRNKKCKLLK